MSLPRKVPSVAISRRIRIVVMLIVLAAGWVDSSSAAADDEFRVKVLSYNIHHAEGVDGKLDLERIAEVIKEVEPDIVALQEVDVETTRSEQVDQARELARLTGMEVRFEKNIEFQGGEYGNAVLTRFPIESTENIALPNVDSGEQRGLLILQLNPDDLDEPIWILATHLDHRRDDQERKLSAEVINEHGETIGEQAAILAGDLNATPDTPVLEILSRVWQIPDGQVHPTVPVGTPRRQIDFVLPNHKRWKVVSTQVLDEAIASDHRAILVELELVMGGE